jgi:hypothetical protein
MSVVAVKLAAEATPLSSKPAAKKGSRIRDMTDLQ